MTRLGALAIALVIAGASAACEPAPRPDPSVCAPSRDVRRRWSAGDPASVIIHFVRDADVPALAASGRSGRGALLDALRSDARRAQARALAMIQRHAIGPPAPLWMINAVAATLPAAVIQDIVRLPEVDRIEPDLLVRAPVTIHGTAARTDWNLAAIGAPALWAAGQRGAGAVVAILDTGVDLEHPDLAAARRTTAAWFDSHDQHPTPFDGDGHGTQVAGLVVGGDASGAPIGVAPEARWIAARIYDDAGVASLGAIHRALQWVLDPDGDPATDDAADVVVAAWGFDQLVGACYLALEPDIAALRAAQIASVFAAGNTGPRPASSISPANNPSALAAGAVDDDLSVIATSARGPDACSGTVFPELVAPGANVRTTDRTLGGQFPDSYVVVSGTSFAAPHIAGAMALLRAAHPSATVSQLEDALTTTAIDLASAGIDHDSGHGLPDLAAAEARLARLVASPRCTDTDGDGYFAEPDCGTPLDCRDGDPTIHPGACDIAGDDIDRDCNGADGAGFAPRNG